MNKSWFYALLILSMIFWGASWVNMKVLSSYIGAFDVVFLRLLFSWISMIPVLWYFKPNMKMDQKSLVLNVLASVALVVYSLMFFYGVKYGTAGLGGALVTSLIPINTFIIVAFLHKKVISLKHSFALVLGGFGVLTMLDIYSFDLNEILAKQNMYFLGASIFWPILTLLSAKVTKINPLVNTFYMYVLSTVCIFIFFIDTQLFLTIMQLDCIFWLNMFVLSVLSTTVATSVYFVGVERFGAKEVSSFIFLVPTSALSFSALFLNERISFNVVIGTLCALTAIYILNNLKLFKKRL